MKNEKHKSGKPSPKKGKRKKDSSTKAVSPRKIKAMLRANFPTNSRKTKRSRAKSTERVLHISTSQQELRITGGGYQLSIFDKIAQVKK